MADPKTTETDGDVDAFLATVQPEVRRRDALALRALMERVTGQPARLWGPSIVGFGRYHYRYPSGREGEMAAAAFSPRKASTTVYVVDGFEGYAAELARLVAASERRPPADPLALTESFEDLLRGQ